VPSAEVAIIGAGAAGLGLAVHLAAAGMQGIVLVQSPEAAPARTWCSWQARPVAWDEAVSQRWGLAEVFGPDGRRLALELAPYRYDMVRSRDFERWAAGRLTDVERRDEHVVEVRDGPSEAVVVTGRGELRARWVVDTRPSRPVTPGRTSLLQHFRGWRVRTAADTFDPAVAGLMDFRVPQPPRAVAFGYVLPTSGREALVEYTEFSRTALTLEQYEAALAAYCTDVLGLGSYQVDEVEQGAIPMTDAPFARRVGAHVLRLGAAGGATRPSTGYTFTAAQRQARAVAAALVAGRDPTPPPAYSRRHLWMDAVLLRALDTGRVDGAALFTQLFRRQPTARVLRFLDGATSPREDLAVMAATPLAPMAFTAVRG